MMQLGVYAHVHPFITFTLNDIIYVNTLNISHVGAQEEKKSINRRTSKQNHYEKIEQVNEIPLLLHRLRVVRYATYGDV